MGWFDKLLGAPTLQSVADKVVMALRQRSAQDISVNLELAEVTATVDGSPNRIYLGNLLADYRRSPRSRRAALLEKFLGGVLPQEGAIPKRYEDAKPKLMPVVRTAADMGVAALSAMRIPTGATAFSGPAHRPLVADLVVALVCDTPTTMAYITEEQLKEWQVSFDEARDEAIHNLRRL